MTLSMHSKWLEYAMFLNAKWLKYATKMTSNPTNKDQEAGICHTSQGQVAGTCKIDNIVLEITHSTSKYALCAWLKLDALCFAVVAFP